jgi:hypothetical protein
MRRPQLRFTLRRMMIAVAIAALLLGVEATRRRWASFRTMAKELGQHEAQCRSMANSMQLASDRGSASEREEMKGKADEYKRIADELSRGRLELERKW